MSGSGSAVHQDDLAVFELQAVAVGKLYGPRQVEQELNPVVGHQAMRRR